MLQLNRYKILRDHIDTLHNLSADNGTPPRVEYVTDSQVLAVCFDHVKDEYTRNLHITNESSDSVDALLNIHGVSTFVEFRNGKITDKKKIRNKARDSLLILCDIANKHISYTRKHMDFILVYNATKNPMSTDERQILSENYGLKPGNGSLEYICRQLTKLSNKNFVRFGVERLRVMFFKDVYTLTKKEFEDFLNEK